MSSHSCEQLFRDISAAQDWVPETEVAVLLEYIENQQSYEAFLDYLQVQVELELQAED